MILKGNSRAHGKQLAYHLLNVEDNEHVTIHELRGFVSEDLFGAFQEIDAVSQGTKCQQYLFSLSLSPPISAKVSVEEFEAAIAKIEQKLGLTDQSRAIVFHEKKGPQGHRRHAHCVWSRININEMKAINLPHYKRRLTEISRELYLEHDWEMPLGLQKSENRNPLNYSHVEAEQSKRIKCDASELKKLFQSCWVSSDSQSAFAAALKEQGFCLARGNRRGFIAVDADGNIYSLSRWCSVKTKELRARLGNGSELPNVVEAIALISNSHIKTSLDVDVDKKHQSLIQAHNKKIAVLVSKQRHERQALLKTQETRRVKGIISFQSRLLVGLKATWSRLTGSYKKEIQTQIKETSACKVSDQLEAQKLIDKHLIQRRALDQELEYLLAQHSLEMEFLQSLENSTGHVYQFDPRQTLFIPREELAFTPEQLIRRPDLILAHISDKKAFFSRNDIVRELAKYISDPLDLRVSIDTALASTKLVKISDNSDSEFTTQDFQTISKSLSDCSTEMARSGGFKVRGSHISRAINRENKKLKSRFCARLSEEQIKAIHHILDPHQLSAVVGLAGTGKSTLLSVAREAWENQGYVVHGAALAGKAADGLQQSSGIQSRTLASLETSWKNGYEPINSGGILVVDEASMVGTRQLARIAEGLRQRGSKMVLVGDPDQLLPIQAGTPFQDIVESTKAARLIEIRRQKSEWQRKASCNLANGQINTAMKSYADHGAFHESQNRDTAIRKLVDDYIEDFKNHGTKNSRLALAHRRVDVHAINQAIRFAKIQLANIRAEIHTEVKEENLFETDHGPRAFTVGDRLLFTRNDNYLNVRNGMLATVEAISDGKLTVLIDNDAGDPRKLTFSPEKFQSIDHGYAVTIHRAQGCTVDRSFVLSSKTLSKNLTYVALTRHREETGFYTAPDISKQRDWNIERSTHFLNDNPLKGPIRTR